MQNLKVTHFDSVFQTGLDRLLRDAWQEQGQFLREQKGDGQSSMLRALGGAFEYQMGVSDSLPVEGLLNILKLKAFVSRVISSRKWGSPALRTNSRRSPRN